MPVDMRARKLAQLAVNYSVAMQPGDKVMIVGDQAAMPFLTEVYKEVLLKGGYPVVRFMLPDTLPFFYKHASQEQIEHFPQEYMDTLKQCQCFIGPDTELNTRELTSADSKKITDRAKVTRPIMRYICDERDKIRRVTIAFPCQAYAQEADMSLTEYEKFVYDACLKVDWSEFGKRLDKINKVFEKGSLVHLIGEKVDLRFSIASKNSVADKGEENMPGGEIFMAPVRESLEGWIQFEYPAIERGKEVTDIRLEFEKGRVIRYSASKNEEFLGEMLQTDDNSCYVGEFRIGCNPGITRFTKSLLFDEKIGGTIHLALGDAYKQNGGGNDSAIHWDIVKDMHNAKIVLDNIVIQEDGEWKI